MAYTFKRLAEVEEIQEAPETAKAFVEVDGEVKRSAMKFQNKNPLTFVGDSEVSYDGSEPVTIKIPQPDYKENDPEKSGYIKNRPFYSETVTDKIYFEKQAITCEPKTTNEGVYNPALTFAYYLMPETFKPDEGVDYVVELDGVEYKCNLEANGLQALSSIGAKYLEHIGEEFPFSFMTMVDTSLIPVSESGWVLLIAGESMEHTLGVRSVSENIVKIPDKYIPQSDWNQNDPAGSGYIKNRPFYTDYDYTTLFEDLTGSADYKHGPMDEFDPPYNDFVSLLLPESFLIEKGDNLLVEIDGKKYNVTADRTKYAPEVTYVNGYFPYLWNNTTEGSPFHISPYTEFHPDSNSSIESGRYYFTMAFTNEPPKTLSIKKASERIVKIPSKYIDVKSITFDLDFTAQDSMVSYEKTIEFNNIDQIKKVIENNMNIMILYKESDIIKLYEYVRCKDSLTTTGDRSYIYGLGQNTSASASPACIKISYSKSPYTIDNMAAAWIDTSIGIEIKSVYATI